MRGSIATYRESLSRIASELSDDDEPQFATAAASFAGDSQSSSAGRRRRRSLRTEASTGQATGSPIPNGSCTDHESFDEIARYKADIQKLQTSEAEIKALSFNYAAMLKEKEDQLSKLREENGSLKKNLEAKVNITSLNSPKGNLGNSRAVGNNSAKFVNNMNGITHNTNGVYKPAISLENEKEYTQIVEEKKSLESEIRELKERLKNEQEKSTKIIQKSEDENKRNSSLQREIHELKTENEKMSKQMRDLQKELNGKTSELKELKQLKQEIIKTPLKKDKIEESTDDLKDLIKSLEKENARLKEEIEAIKNNRTSQIEDQNNSEKETLISQLEKKLVIISKEKEKYSQELSRLKQHLLEKENEDSIMEELEIKIEDQNSRIVQLERALRQETVKKEEIKALKDQEIQKLNELVNGLNRKLASCVSNLELKNTELVNLQTALGQYYAESEAKERIGRDLALAREEINRLTVSLNVANQGIEMTKREKDEILSKLSQNEGTLNEAKKFIQKLEEDKSRLNLALEKSMRALNRMSLDSDNQVDRRIVIKLLVTYFQRNHSKEVLDLMVRMLGFSEEEKERIGGAQRTAGKGVVRGVLGLPGKLVGGILGGGGSGGAHTSSSSNDQESFADLWVDFLLKEEEEREKREASSSNNNQDHISNPNQINNNNSNFSNNNTNYSNSEFSSVPLNSTSFYSEPPQR
ncbi:hypothetical protein LUZ60_013609 [Juncus effusus]|nr:hypothetical protein LUZ60_013609 [Juncus effusus]